MADFTNITSNKSVYASFVTEKATYDIKFINFDGTLLQYESLEYGVMPEYKGEIPTREATERATYIFSGWAPNITFVNSNAIYQAEYTEILNQFTVTFYDEEGGLVIGVSIVDYGTTAIFDGELPIKASTAEYTSRLDKCDI